MSTPFEYTYAPFAAVVPPISTLSYDITSASAVIGAIARRSTNKKEITVIKILLFEAFISNLLIYLF